MYEQTGDETTGNTVTLGVHGCALVLCLKGVGFALGTLGFLLVQPTPPLASPLDSLS